MRIYAWQNIFPAWCCYSEAAVSECRDSKLLATLPAGSWHMTLGKQSFNNLKIPKNNGGKIIFKYFKAGPICNLSDVLFSIYFSEYFPTSKLNRNLDYSNWQINLIWSRTQGFYIGKLLPLNLHVNINTGARTHLIGQPRYIRRQLDRIHQKVWQSTESTTMTSSRLVLALWLLHCSLYLKRGKIV